MLTLAETEDDGGAPILSYSLYHDSGNDFSSSFTKISGFTGGASHTVTRASLGNPSQGSLFRFRYSATNEIGESEMSQLIVQYAPIPTEAPTLYKDETHHSDGNEYKLHWEMRASGDLNVTGFRVYSDFAGRFGEEEYTLIYEGPSDILDFTFKNSSLNDPTETVKFKLQPLYFNGGGAFS